MGLPTNKVFTPGFRLIADDDGNYIDDVNYLRLSSKFSLTRNAADPSAVIDLSPGAIVTSDIADGSVTGPKLANSGTTAGRIGAEILIERKVLTAATGWTSTTWAAGAYRSLRMKLRLDSGASNEIGVTLAGLTGTYRTTFEYQQNGASPVGFKYDANWNIDLYTNCQIWADMEIETGGIRTMAFRGITGSDAGGTGMKSVRGECINDDTTHNVTGLVLAFAAASTGIGYLWGVP